MSDNEEINNVSSEKVDIKKDKKKRKLSKKQKISIILSSIFAFLLIAFERFYFLLR